MTATALHDETDNHPRLSAQPSVVVATARRLRTALAALTLVIATLFFSAANAPAAGLFIPLGDFAGGTNESYGLGISADGSIAVGFGYNATQQMAFSWTSPFSPGALFPLGNLPSSASPRSAANGISGDGLAIVGSGINSSSQTEAFRWTSGGGMVGIGFLPLHTYSVASAASHDGTVVVGESRTNIFGDEQAYRWTTSGGGTMTSLGNMGGGNFSSAYGVSSNGNVVVGYTSVPLGMEAFLWTTGSGMTNLGVLSGATIHESTANGVSADGNVVVGWGWNSSTDQEAFRWTSGGGMTGLGDLAGGIFSSVAYATSADGSVVVGQGDSAAGTEAFIWDAVNGMRSLSNVLAGAGVTNFMGWQRLDVATGVSADGSTIVGFGLNALGETEAFVAVIPEPSTAALAGIGSLGFGLLAWRRRKARNN